MPEQKIDRAVASPDSVGLWKVSAKFELWFQIQATKKMALKFLQKGEKVKISNFFVWFCLKKKLLEEKMDTSVACPYSK